MRISAAVTVVFATLVSTVCGHPAAELEARPVLDVEKRQVGVSTGAAVSVNAVLVANLGLIREHTANINNTAGTINSDSTWVQKNNAIMTIRSEMTAIGAILAAGTSQIGTLGGNLGGDLNTISSSALAIANEIIYTLQYAVNRLGSGLVVVLGISINSVMSVLGGLLLAVNILAQGTLSNVVSAMNASLPTFIPAVGSIVQGLKYLVGY